jgi:DNA-binding MarR family transcriptional regulator
VKSTDLSECALCLCLASRRAARALTRAYDRRLRSEGIRATQLSVLVMLALRGPTRIGALADALGLERTTLTRNLALLEKRKWVKIRPGEDSRARIAQLTAIGRRKAEVAVPAWREAQAAAIAVLGENGTAALRGFDPGALR